MSCNCNNNPCSCASANCACPPNYSVPVATLTCQGTNCEDTIETSCIFVDQNLSCVQTLAGVNLTTVLAAMDTKICQCGSCSGNTHISPNIDNMAEYWVDSSNTVAGDGSVTNPFQSLDLAYAKIIGSGTPAAPTNTGITVMVLPGVGYTTSINIFIIDTIWHFISPTRVTFNGSNTYFIDSSVMGTGGGEFRVTGYMYFSTSTGGFLKHEGSYYSLEKHVILEVAEIIGTTNNQGLPLIYQNLTNAANIGAPIRSFITMKHGGLISSAVSPTITYTGGSMDINLNGGILQYGINAFTQGVTGLSNTNCIFYNNSDTSSFKYFASFNLTNGSINSAGNTDIIYISGNYTNILFDNIKVTGYSGTLITSFLNVGNVTLNVSPIITGTNPFLFLLKNVYLAQEAFSHTGNVYVVTYTGASQHFDYLEMQDCVLDAPLEINTNIRLGLITSGLSAIGSKNIINGQIRMYQLPTSSVGLASGTVWSNAGILTIV